MDETKTNNLCTETVTIDQTAFPDIERYKNGGIKLLKTYENFRYLMEQAAGLPRFELVQQQLLPPEGWKSRNDKSIQEEEFATFCMDTCQRCGLSVPYDELRRWLRLLAMEQRFSMVEEYFAVLRRCGLREGEATIHQAFACLGLPEDAPEYVLFRKWLVQCVAMAHNFQGSYGADFVLVLQSEQQGIGKTSFFRYLFKTLSRYFASERDLDPDDTDSRMENTRYWCVELSELERMTRKELGSLKSFLTRPMDEYRVPYGRAAEKHPRLTCYCGTVNNADFLKESGRRFAVIPIKRVNLRALEQVDVEDLWSEAFRLFWENPDGWRLTEAERDQVVRISNEFVQVTDEEQALLDCLDWSVPVQQWTERTATEIQKELGLRSPQAVSKGLKKILAWRYETPDLFFKRKTKGLRTVLVPPYLPEWQRRIERAGHSHRL